MKVCHPPPDRVAEDSETHDMCHAVEKVCEFSERGKGGLGQKELLEGQ